MRKRGPKLSVKHLAPLPASVLVSVSIRRAAPSYSSTLKSGANMVLCVWFLSDKMSPLLLLPVSVKRQRTMSGGRGRNRTGISVVISETVKTRRTRVPVMKEFILSQYMRLYLNAASGWTEQGITAAPNPDADTSRSPAAALIIYREGV